MELPLLLLLLLKIQMSVQWSKNGPGNLQELQLTSRPNPATRFSRSLVALENRFPIAVKPGSLYKTLIKSALQQLLKHYDLNGPIGSEHTEKTSGETEIMPGDKSCISTAITSSGITALALLLIITTLLKVIPGLHITDQNALLLPNTARSDVRLSPYTIHYPNEGALPKRPGFEDLRYTGGFIPQALPHGPQRLIRPWGAYEA